MKTFRMLFACACLVLLSSIGAWGQNVQTDYDHKFNLAKFKSYRFYAQRRGPGDALAASPINDRRIYEALDNELSDNGFAENNEPDFWVSYFVMTRTGYDIQDNRFGVLQRMGNVSVEPVTQATLVVIFTDNATQQEVWRGYAAGDLNPRNFDRDLNKAVAKLIQKFKKNQAGQK